MIVHHAYVYTTVLEIIQGPERKSVLLHHASQHAVTDVNKVQCG
jgi:hypothetical protein